VPRRTTDSWSIFAPARAEVLAAQSPMPVQELARRVPASGHVAFALFKIAWRLWVALDNAADG
jgi:hypothetical protein